jgi:hypothetical protein
LESNPFSFELLLNWNQFFQHRNNKLRRGHDFFWCTRYSTDLEENFQLRLRRKNCWISSRSYLGKILIHSPSSWDPFRPGRFWGRILLSLTGISSPHGQQGLDGRKETMPRSDLCLSFFFLRKGYSYDLVSPHEPSQQHNCTRQVTWSKSNKSPERYFVHQVTGRKTWARKQSGDRQESTWARKQSGDTAERHETEGNDQRSMVFWASTET